MACMEIPKKDKARKRTNIQNMRRNMASVYNGQNRMPDSPAKRIFTGDMTAG